MRKADYAELAAFHNGEAAKYYKQAARFGGAIGANARSYAAHHASEARKFQGLADKTEGGNHA